ncbi:MAG: hypothetical protein EAZ34_01955 [Polaromonas sp.]|nr:MAG: hypothetical protein EAZ34_01955 [Polaromonas sp.]
MKLLARSRCMQLHLVRTCVRLAGSAGGFLLLPSRHGGDFVTEKNAWSARLSAWLMGRVDDESLQTALLHAFRGSRCYDSYNPGNDKNRHIINENYRAVK